MSQTYCFGFYHTALGASYEASSNARQGWQKDFDVMRMYDVMEFVHRIITPEIQKANERYI